MSDWRPSSPPAAAATRAALLARAREYFAGRDVLEVDTPALSPFAVSDPNIESFAVGTVAGSRYYLHTSPEYCMKRLLAGGYPDIYAVSRVFRDGETGRQHLCEFTLLEWYRHDFELSEIVADTIGLVTHCLGGRAPRHAVAVVDYADCVLQHAGIDVFTATCDRIAERLDADAGLRAALGEDRDAWLDLLLDACVVPALPADRLTVIRHFPASKAALARLCPADSRVADRFELFAGRTELANGYVELTDAAEQRRRFAAETDKRRAAGGGVVEGDERLLAALESGLPACSGVAVGVERLQMVHDGTEDIADVVTFADN